MTGIYIIYIYRYNDSNRFLIGLTSPKKSHHEAEPLSPLVTTFGARTSLISPTATGQNVLSPPSRAGFQNHFTRVFGLTGRARPQGPKSPRSEGRCLDSTLHPHSPVGNKAPTRVLGGARNTEENHAMPESIVWTMPSNINWIN